MNDTSHLRADERLRHIASLLSEHGGDFPETTRYIVSHLAEENEQAIDGRDYERFPEAGEIAIVYPIEVVVSVDLEEGCIRKVRIPTDTIKHPRMKDAPPDVKRAYEIAESQTWPSWEALVRST